MSNSAPGTPRQEPITVTSSNFYYFFKKTLEIKGPGAMHLALLKITRLEAENRLLRKELQEVNKNRILSEIRLKENIEKIQEKVDDVKLRMKARSHALETANGETKKVVNGLSSTTNIILKENSELKIATNELKTDVVELKGIAKWKLDVERYEKVKFDLDRYVQGLKNYRDDLGSMKKQKYKIQSKVSQLENTITRQSENMRLDLKDIKKQRKKLQREKEELASVKEAKVFAAKSLTNFTSNEEDFSSDPRVLMNCQMYDLAINEVPRPDYIPLKFEALRNIWGTLSHFDYKHCLRVLSNYRFMRLRPQNTVFS